MPHLPVILSVFFHGTVRDSRTPAVMNLIETTVLRTGVEACPYTAAVSRRRTIMFLFLCAVGIKYGELFKVNQVVTISRSVLSQNAELAANNTAPHVAIMKSSGPAIPYNGRKVRR